jgi:hypothetical protein
MLRATISSVRDVLQVLDLSLLIDRPQRKLGVATVIQTPYGAVEFEAFLQ